MQLMQNTRPKLTPAVRHAFTDDWEGASATQFAEQ